MLRTCLEYTARRTKETKTTVEQFQVTKSQLYTK